jgi:streptomycin 6-kinase
VAPIVEIPEPFKGRVSGAFAGGAAWLDSLPSLIAQCEARWKIKAGAPFALSFNYVAPALTAGGEPVVLKLGVPDPGMAAEIRALQAYAGTAAVRLLDSDEGHGMMLLERIEPGHTLASLADDERATYAAAQVMRDLWTPLPPDTSFPTAVEWAGGLTKLRLRFDGGTGPFPARLVDQAGDYFATCCLHRSHPGCSTATCITSIFWPLAGGPGSLSIQKVWRVKRHMRSERCCATPIHACIRIPRYRGGG